MLMRREATHIQHTFQNHPVKAIRMDTCQNKQKESTYHEQSKWIVNPAQWTEFGKPSRTIAVPSELWI